MQKQIIIIILALAMAISGCGRVAKSLEVDNTYENANGNNYEEAIELATYYTPINSEDGAGSIYLTEIATIPAINL